MERTWILETKKIKKSDFYKNKKVIKIDDIDVNKILVSKNASSKCLSIIMLDSVVKVKKKYYPQTLLEECKYEIKKTKMENLIDDSSEKSSSDESDNEVDNDSNDETESDNEKDNDESNE